MCPTQLQIHELQMEEGRFMHKLREFVNSKGNVTQCKGQVFQIPYCASEQGMVWERFTIVSWGLWMRTLGSWQALLSTILVRLRVSKIYLYWERISLWLLAITSIAKKNIRLLKALTAKSDWRDYRKASIGASDDDIIYIN